MKKLSVVGLLFFFASCSYNGGKAGFLTIAGTKIYYEEHGRGVPLVILSGGGINRSVRDFDLLHLDSTYLMGRSDGALPADIDISQVKPQALDVWAENNKELIKTYTTDLKKDWKKMMSSLNTMWYQEKYFPDSILNRIQVPTMIVQGDKDDINVRHAVELHSMIPNSELCILPNTTHEVFSERPELISDLAMDFFD
jgi:pimeloyl-ACP methyl ester carboxylesterase